MFRKIVTLAISLAKFMLLLVFVADELQVLSAAVDHTPRCATGWLRH
jgi:hypothetical protein